MTTSLERYNKYRMDEPSWSPYQVALGHPQMWKKNHENEVKIHTEMTPEKSKIWSAMHDVYMCEKFDLDCTWEIGVYRCDIDIGVRPPQDGQRPTAEFLEALSAYKAEQKNKAIQKYMRLKQQLETARAEAGEDVANEIRNEYKRRTAQWERWTELTSYDGTPYINPFPYY